MKKLIILMQLFWIGAGALNGQGSSMMTDSVIYITPEDEVLLRDKKAKYLFKLGSDIGFEFKVAKAFSLEIELWPDNLSAYNSSNFNFGVGGRYYYKMAKRIASGKQANNFSGKYISAMYSYGYGRNNTIIPVLNFDRTIGYSLGIGTQQRYLQNEYFDFGLLFDYQNVSFGNGLRHDNYFTIRTESNYGFVFGKKHQLNDENLCPVVKCYQDKKTALKINRNNLFNLSINEEDFGTFWRLVLGPKISYEFKLRRSPFSINQELYTSLVFDNLPRGSNANNGEIIESFRLSRNSIRYGLSARYYFRMKNKILSGEQGNNLSGGYVYAKFVHDYWSNRFYPNFNKGSVLMGIGRQTRITGPLYFDARFGLGPKIYGDNFTSAFELDISDDISLETNFTIGYMF